MKALSKRYNLKSFIVFYMKDIITFNDNNIKFVVYTGGGYLWTLLLSRSDCISTTLATFTKP